MVRTKWAHPSKGFLDLMTLLAKTVSGNLESVCLSSWCIIEGSPNLAQRNIFVKHRSILYSVYIGPLLLGPTPKFSKGKSFMNRRGYPIWLKFHCATKNQFYRNTKKVKLHVFRSLQRKVTKIERGSSTHVYIIENSRVNIMVLRNSIGKIRAIFFWN